MTRKLCLGLVLCASICWATITQIPLTDQGGGVFTVGITDRGVGVWTVDLTAAPVAPQPSTNAPYWFTVTTAAPTNAGSAGSQHNWAFVGGGADPTFTTNTKVCMYFDGGDYANMGTNATVANGATQLTMFGWFNVETFSTYDALFCERGTAGIHGFAEDATVGILDAYVQNTRVWWTTAYTTGTWFHAVSTWDKASRDQMLYINGSFVTNRDVGSSATMGVDDVWKFGFDDFNAARKLVGFIGGPIGLYPDYVWSAADASNEYNTTKGDYGF